MAGNYMSDPIDFSLPLFFSDLAYALANVKATDGDCSDIELSFAFKRFCDELVLSRERQARVIFVGNGGSSAIASHMATDFSKIGIHALSFSDAPLLTAWANDNGFDSVYSNLLKLQATHKDLLVAISSSGRSKNILNACEEVLNIGGKILTLSGMDEDNPLREYGQVNFHVSDSRYSVIEVAHHAICHAAVEACLCRTSEGKFDVQRQAGQDRYNAIQVDRD